MDPLLQTLNVSAIKGRAGEGAAAHAQVITGSSDGTVRVWDGKTADCITAFRPPQAAPRAPCPVHISICWQ